MDRETMEIVERLALVERSMRRNRAALAVVTVIAVAGLTGPSLVGAAKAPGVIQAKSFAVVDDNGMVRASLGTSGDGTGLALLDKAGNIRAGLAARGANTALILNDKAGNRRATLGDDDLKITATGSTEHRAASSLVLFNEHGRVLWEAP